MSYVAGPGLNGTGREGLWELKCAVSKRENGKNGIFFIIKCKADNMAAYKIKC